MLDIALPDRVHVVTTRSLSCTPVAAGVPTRLPPDSQILGRARGENFRVASIVLPRRARAHLLAFYGFARLVDEIGDSYTGDRLQALDWVEAETRAALDGAEGCHGLVAGAARSVRHLGIDPAPLFRLIDANRMDQRVHAYPTFEDLLAYCRLSADPVGHLVLGAFGYHDDERLELSDRICTGLQLVEHWQDVLEDAMAGRVYIPLEDLDRFGVDRDILGRRGATPQSLRALMAFESARARAWLDRGLPLARTLPRQARWAVAGFWAGGRAALDAAAARDFDVLAGPSHPRRDRTLRHLVTALGAARP